MFCDHLVNLGNRPSVEHVVDHRGSVVGVHCSDLLWVSARC
jgi:hypothetical protein